jgi:hypothetical protein
MSLYDDCSAERDIGGAQLGASFGVVPDLFEMANRLYRGVGVPQDRRQAIAYYKEAADKGHAKARWNLATLYQLGDATPVNAAQNAAWYFGLAAQSGVGAPPETLRESPKQQKQPKPKRESTNAPKTALYDECVRADTEIERTKIDIMLVGRAPDLFEMANRLYRGLGVPQDKRQAAAYYKRAADQGHAKAQWNIATLYLLGEATPQSVFQTAAWYFELAAKSGITSPPEAAAAPKQKQQKPPRAAKSTAATRRRVMPSEKQALSLRFEHRCALCRELLPPGWHADHVIPLADGGPDDAENMQPLCCPCHTLKTALENSTRPISKKDI